MALQAAHAVARCVRQSLEFPPGVHLPRHVRARAQKVLRDIAASLKRMPPGPGSWSGSDSIAELNLADWRFEYRIDPESGSIRVITAEHIESQAV